MPTLDLNNRTTSPLASNYQRVWVWTRKNWADDWTPRPDIIPTQISWAMAPTLDAAELVYHYGYVIPVGGSAETLLPPLDASRFYVLIRCDCSDGSTRDWLGRTDPPETVQHFPARQRFPATGTQSIKAVGLLRSLQRSPVLSTVHEIAPESATFRRSPNVGATFNPDLKKGNRTAAKQTLAVDTKQTLAAYAFADINNAAAKFWSTRDIVEHLLTWHLSTADGNLLDPIPDDAIPWIIGDLDPLPDWDKPLLATDARSTASLLDALLRSSKLLGYRVRAVVTHPELEGNDTPFTDGVDLPTVDEVRVEFFTATDETIDLPEIGYLPAAATQYTIAAIDDPLTTITTTEDTIESVDQIQLRGPREIGVATFRHTSELVDDWTPAALAEYTAGASGEAGYSSRTPSEKRAADDRIRSKKSLAGVFSRLKFKANWNGTASGDPVFVPDPDDEDESTNETHIPYTGELDFLAGLPLYESVDYFGPADEVDEDDGLKTIPALITLENPRDATRVRIEKLGITPTGNENSVPNLKPFRLAANVTKPLGLELSVSAGPKHAIAGGTFSGTTADPAQSVFGGYDYKTIQATLALVGNRRPAILIPAEVNRPLVERKIVTLEHPALQLVYIAAATVIDIDADGDPLTSDGGLLRDPMPTLEAIAKIVAKHVLAPRRRLQITTPRRFSEIYPGDLIATVDTYGEAIAAPVSQITLRLPLNDNHKTTPAETTITAASFQANVAELFG